MSKQSNQWKIYFCGSIQGGRQDGQLYATIIKDHLHRYGTVLNDVVGHPDVLKIEDSLDTSVIYDGAVTNLQAADVLVAEVTQPSLGVGVELGMAQVWNKKILCLFRPASGRTLSAMVRGGQNKNLVVKDYSETELEAILKAFFGDLRGE